MSFHRYLVPPPLALAVHPAPAVAPRTPKKDKDSAAKDGAKDGAAKDGAAKDGAAKDGAAKDGAAKDGAATPGANGDAALGGPDAGLDAAPALAPDGPAPASPQSNVPEPPTPAPGAPPRSANGDGAPPAGVRDKVQAVLERRRESLALEGKDGRHGDEADKAVKAVDGAVEGADEKPEAEHAKSGDKAGDKADDKPNGDVADKAVAPDAKAADDKAAADKAADDKTADEKTADDKPAADKTADAPPPPPLRLLSPAPPKYVRTRIDVHGAKPYPPVYADPRGAYHAYAKWVQTGGPYIDVTKDGWLVEQWRERPEREALARLRGDAERERQRQLEADKRRAVVRKVPTSAEHIVLELYNDLVEAPHNELSVASFWARYDWADPEAAVHLLDIRRQIDEKERREGDRHRYRAQNGAAGDASDAAGDKGKPSADKDVQKEEDAAANANDGKKDAEAANADVKVDAKPEADVKVGAKPEADAAASKQPAPEPDEDVEFPAEHFPDVEWTKGGLEETLATVGIVCTYNIVPARELSYGEPMSSLLVQSHGYFLLRPDDYFSWRAEGNSDKFEALVVSGNDRVFGDMVKQQQAEERRRKEAAYRQRKEEQRRKEEEERRARKERGEPEPEKGEGVKGEKEEKGRKDGKGETPDQHEAGKEQGGEKKGADAVVVALPAEEQAGSNVKVVDGEPVDKAAPGGEAVVRPLLNGDAHGKTLDDKHEAEPVLEAVKVVKSGDKVHAEAGCDLAGDAQDGKEGKDGKDAPVGDAAKDGKEVPDAKDDKAEKDGKDGENGKNPKDAHDAKDAKDAKGAKDEARRQRERAKKHDPLAEAEMVARMMGLDADGPLNMEDLKLAMRALEMTAAKSAAHAAPVERARGPLVWAWQERCERWRWAIFSAGVHDVRPGGWEERDWREYADGRGYNDFVEDMRALEVCEIDVHDWSC